MTFAREELALRIAYRLYVRDRRINAGRYSMYGQHPSEPIQTFEEFCKDRHRHRRAINEARVCARIAIEEYGELAKPTLSNALKAIFVSP